MEVHDQQKLAQGLRAGSTQAWSSLYQAYAQRVWRDIARLTGADVASVADMVQETFLAAAQSAARYDPQRGPVWAWLWSLARRQAALYFRKAGRDELRRARQWWASLDGERRDLFTAAAEGPPELLASRELAAIVRAALTRLPTTYQVLLSAKYMEGQSSAQIAAELFMTPAAVDSKLARARKELRRSLARVAGSKVGFEAPRVRR